MSQSEHPPYKRQSIELGLLLVNKNIHLLALVLPNHFFTALVCCLGIELALGFWIIRMQTLDGKQHSSLDRIMLFSQLSFLCLQTTYQLTNAPVYRLKALVNFLTEWLAPSKKYSSLIMDSGLYLITWQTFWQFAYQEITALKNLIQHKQLQGLWVLCLGYIVLNHPSFSLYAQVFLWLISVDQWSQSLKGLDLQKLNECSDFILWSLAFFQMTITIAQMTFPRIVGPLISPMFPPLLFTASASFVTLMGKTDRRHILPKVLTTHAVLIVKALILSATAFIAQTNIYSTKVFGLLFGMMAALNIQEIMVCRKNIKVKRRFLSQTTSLIFHLSSIIISLSLMIQLSPLHASYFHVNVSRFSDVLQSLFSVDKLIVNGSAFLIPSAYLGLSLVEKNCYPILFSGKHQELIMAFWFVSQAIIPPAYQIYLFYFYCGYSCLCLVERADYCITAFINQEAIQEKLQLLQSLVCHSFTLLLTLTYTLPKQTAYALAHLPIRFTQLADYLFKSKINHCLTVSSLAPLTINHMSSLMIPSASKAQTKPEGSSSFEEKQGFSKSF